MNEDGGSSRRRVAWAALVLGVASTLAFAVMLARVAQLQLDPPQALAEHVAARVAMRDESGVRGDLLDRARRPLAVMRFGRRVVVDPTILPNKKPGDLDGAIVALAGAAGIDPDALGMRIHGVLEKNRSRPAGAAGIAAAPRGLRAWLASRLKSRVGGVEVDAPGEELALEDADPLAVVEEEAPGAAKGPIRYVPVTRIIDDARADAVAALKMPGVVVERRAVREYPGGAPVASILGLVGFEGVGLMGAEQRLEEALRGESGRVRFVHAASGAPLWMRPGFVEPAQGGLDVRLSLDLELQRIAVDELERGVTEADAAGGRCIVLDPLTGEVLAMADVRHDLPDLAPFPWEDAPAKGTPGARGSPVGVPPRRYQTMPPGDRREVHPALARNRCLEDVYEPGSTFKPFVWSVITELGLAQPDEVLDTEGGRWHTSYGRYIEDVTKRASMTWCEVLINSSNIGMIKASERLTPAQLSDAIARFGFGTRTGLGLAGEASGIVTSLKQWTKYTHTSVAYGHELAVTPIQMARAFSAFCRPGELAGTLPQVRLTAVAPTDADGDGVPTARDYQRGVVYRAIPSEVAMLTRDTLKDVASNVELRMAEREGASPGDAAIAAAGKAWRYTMFGKSGTAEIPLGKAPKGKRRPRGTTGYYDDQYNSSFIAGAPIESPRLVVLVVIDDPGPDLVARRAHYGSRVAGPVVRRIVERALTYLGVSPSNRSEANEVAATQAVR